MTPDAEQVNTTLTALSQPASQLSLIRTAIALVIVVAAIGAAVIWQNQRVSESVKRDIAATQEVETEAAIEAALADYDRKMGESIARDREAINAYYEDTKREVDSYVMWRLDEALRESNRIISDAINDAELIRSEAVGVSKIGATE